MNLATVAKALSADLNGQPDREIVRVVHPADARAPEDLALAMTEEALADLSAESGAAAVVPEGVDGLPDGLTAIRYGGHQRVALAILTNLFDRGPSQFGDIHTSAVIDPSATIAADVAAGPHATIGARSSVGQGTRILANATIGADVEIGRDCLLYPGVVVGDGTRIGDRVIVHANATLGADGFSFIPVRRENGDDVSGTATRIHSIGCVVIEDDVEIGAGTTVDRATLRQTRIGRGTKIDNQVQIAHNTVIGENCIICGNVGIAGSVELGDRVIVGAGSGIRDHGTVADDAMIGAMSGVGSHIPAGTRYSGTPATEHTVWAEQLINVRRLRGLYPRVAKLDGRLAALEKTAAADERKRED